MNFNEFLNEKYTRDDINTLYGFYGAMEDEHNEKIADEIFDAAVKDLMKIINLKLLLLLKNQLTNLKKFQKLLNLELQLV